MTKVQECLVNNLKRYRKQLCLTQELLAKAMNIETLQLFQAGESFSVQNHIDIKKLEKNLIKNLKGVVKKSINEI